MRGQGDRQLTTGAKEKERRFLFSSESSLSRNEKRGLFLRENVTVRSPEPYVPDHWDLRTGVPMGVPMTVQSACTVTFSEKESPVFCASRERIQKRKGTFSTFLSRLSSIDRPLDPSSSSSSRKKSCIFISPISPPPPSYLFLSFDGGHIGLGLFHIIIRQRRIG